VSLRLEVELTTTMGNNCHFCKRALETTFFWVARGQPLEPVITHAVWADTSQGRIGVCNLCYEQERFNGLTSRDIGALHYLFGEPYSETAVDYLVSVKRLRRAFALCPCPEIEGALGYAYWKTGQMAKAVRHCRSSVRQQPNHFGASKAFTVLKREDREFDKLKDHLDTMGRRVKSVAAEFPGQRIRRPKH